MTTEQALSRYGRHDKACPLNHEANLPGDPRCTCGFSRALKQLQDLEPWNITQLSRALHDDLKACTCDFERQNCKALATIEIRALRDKIAASGRKFTPGECSVMDDLGISYQPWNAKAVVGLSQ